eukprot:296913-Chlamydomonas_euryale.AAC.3
MQQLAAQAFAGGSATAGVAGASDGGCMSWWRVREPAVGGGGLEVAVHVVVRCGEADQVVPCRPAARHRRLRMHTCLRRQQHATRHPHTPQPRCRRRSAFADGDLKAEGHSTRRCWIHSYWERRANAAGRSPPFCLRGVLPRSDTVVLGKRAPCVYNHCGHGSMQASYSAFQLPLQRRGPRLHRPTNDPCTLPPPAEHAAAPVTPHLCMFRVRA